MNNIARIIVSTSIALVAFSAQAEAPRYSQAVIVKSVASQAAPVSNQPTPYIFQGEFLVDNPAYKVVARSRAEVRVEARQAHDARVSEFRG